MTSELNEKKIAVIGLGYVGLPLAVEFSKKYETHGYDISKERITNLLTGYDKTGEIVGDDIAKLRQIKFTSDVADIASCDIYIITVPTPINSDNEPDLNPLIQASNLVGNILTEGNMVIYESTVFPGATEDVCVPILEDRSKLSYNTDFGVGYSPERINPGDRVNTLTKIKKVTSGSNREFARLTEMLYSSIITAGVYSASSIKVAETAKVIENTQRDVNIALINEFSRMFRMMNIDTSAVLEAASTKWNFINLTPGLVGGHCIGIDPYYLIHKSQQIGYTPNIMTTARNLNESMPQLIAQDVLSLVSDHFGTHVGKRCLVAGVTFKADCPDLRNTKVINLVNALQKEGLLIDIYDPIADTDECKQEYNISIHSKLTEKIYDIVIVAVDHDMFKSQGLEKWRDVVNAETLIFDLKAIYPKDRTHYRL